jgi:hypothetical protein
MAGRGGEAGTEGKRQGWKKREEEKERKRGGDGFYQSGAP